LSAPATSALPGRAPDPARPRAAIVVTGSELVRGERTDLNGPFLAAEALSLGLDPARITIVGDGPDELEAVLAGGLDADLCLVSGGLGPTHDDRTVEVVARVAGRELVLDDALHDEIGAVSRQVAERLRRPYADFEPGVRKQATLPQGAISLGLAGTAPGMVLDTGGGAVVVLPGPPSELRRLWPRALETGPVRRVLAHAQPPGRRVLRFYGASESAVAKALADAGGDGDGVEATICAREFEIHVDLLFGPGAEQRAETLDGALVEPLAQHLFARDERPVEAFVLDLCRARGWTLGTAESCTGGLVAARLTSVPGSSDVFQGAVVSYADAVKKAELGVSAATLAEHGAVSAQTAAEMAAGVRARLGVDVGVAVTGIAGPDGGTPEKPVGLVYLHAQTPEGGHGIEFSFPADRDTVRTRSTVAALHLVRRLLSQNGDSRV
jgi:nicotinamide-nucleotide amidase